MNPNAYLKTKVMTASPQELRLMLFEGAVRFCRTARKAILAKDYETSYNNLCKSQKIVLELTTSLNHNANPEICDKLNALYTYIYKLLIDTNMTREVKPLDDAIKLLDFERETWQMLVDKARAEDAPEQAQATPTPSVDYGQPPADRVSSLSISG